MNKRSMVMLSIPVIVLVSIGINQLDELPQSRVKNRPMLITDNQKSDSVVKKNKLSSISAMQVDSKLTEESQESKYLSKQESNAQPKILSSNALINSTKDELASDHQEKYAQARPHGHERVTSNIEHHDKSKPPGEPKKAVELLQPAK